MEDRFKLKVLYRGKIYTDYIIHSNGMIDILRKKIGNIYTDKAKFIQCTGLKDKNGKLIFEGDIVKVYDLYAKEPYKTTQVIWSKTSAQFKAKGCKRVFGFCDTYESIGNIYENPELLEQNDKN